MADWNHNGSYDPQDAFLDAETFAESSGSCHCDCAASSDKTKKTCHCEGACARGNPSSPSSLPRFLDGLLTALFWLFLFVLVVLFC